VLKHDELGVLNPSDLPISPAYTFTDGHGRPHIGANWGQLTPPGKMDEKLKSENMQKRAVFYVYVIF